MTNKEKKLAIAEIKKLYMKTNNQAIKKVIFKKNESNDAFRNFYDAVKSGPFLTEYIETFGNINVDLQTKTAIYEECPMIIYFPPYAREGTKIPIVISKIIPYKSGIKITRIEVEEESRNKGFGTSFMNCIIDYAKGLKIDLYLESGQIRVIEFNPLRFHAWALKLGFKLIMKDEDIIYFFDCNNKFKNSINPVIFPYKNGNFKLPLFTN